MSLVTLAQVLQPALKQGYAVAGVVCLGWEDMRAYVAAAEIERSPLILQAGPGCRAHTPLPIIAKMFRHLAENASVPIVAHLDHGTSIEECRQAIEEGFSSVMFDGSSKALQQNIDETAEVAELAHRAGVSCEGEIGYVGYAGGAASYGTDPAEAALFAKKTMVDAIAISVGNVHLQQDQETMLDLEKIKAIETLTNVPLVIHGGSGVSQSQRKFLSASSNICKFNIGTELRLAFGQALRLAVNSDPTRFDRNAILSQTHLPVVEATRQVLCALGSSHRV